VCVFQQSPFSACPGLYLLIKLVFLLNVVGQFFLLDAFLGGFYRLHTTIKPDFDNVFMPVVKATVIIRIQVHPLTISAISTVV